MKLDSDEIEDHIKMKTPKLTIKQLTALSWMRYGDWIKPSDYARGSLQLFQELHQMGLVEKKENDRREDEYRKRTQKEIIEHYQNKK